MQRTGVWKVHRPTHTHTTKAVGLTFSPSLLASFSTLWDFILIQFSRSESERGGGEKIPRPFGTFLASLRALPGDECRLRFLLPSFLFFPFLQGAVVLNLWGRANHKWVNKLFLSGSREGFGKTVVAVCSTYRNKWVGNLCST